MIQRQMTVHTLDAIKNSVTNPHHVDYRAKLSSDVSLTTVYAGRCLHLNADGEYELGLPNVSRACHMPLFNWQNSDDYDVATPNTLSEAGGYIGATPSGYMKTLPAIGGWELETTEFDTTQTYTPGDGLTSPDETTATANGDVNTAGRIEPGVAYNVPLCGVVSKGAALNCHRRNCLYFWPVFLPKYAAD